MVYVVEPKMHVSTMWCHFREYGPYGGYFFLQSGLDVSKRLLLPLVLGATLYFHPHTNLRLNNPLPPRATCNPSITVVA